MIDFEKVKKLEKRAEKAYSLFSVVEKELLFQYTNHWDAFYKELIKLPKDLLEAANLYLRRLKSPNIHYDHLPNIDLKNDTIEYRIGYGDDTWDYKIPIKKSAKEWVEDKIKERLSTERARISIAAESEKKLLAQLLKKYPQ